MEKVNMDWWKDLSDSWKQLFQINYVIEFRFSKEIRKDFVKPGIHPLENYKMKLGEEFSPFEMDEEKLSKIIDLTGFYAANFNLESIDPLRSLYNLQVIDLSYNPIADLNVLGKFSEAKDIYLERSGVESLDFLSNLLKVKELYLRDNYITDLTLLASLKNVEFVDVGVNQITDITPLSKLPELKELLCDFNQLTDANALANNASIEILDLSNNRLKEIKFLFKMSKVKSIYLEGNPFNSDKYDFETLKRKGIEVFL